MKLKKCEECGKEFLPAKHGNTHRFCSDRCQSRNWARRAKTLPRDEQGRVIRVCPVCKKEFPLDKGTPRKYCSEECLRHARRYIYPYHKVCEICGKEFDAAWHSVRFCSKECRAKYRLSQSAAKKRNVEVAERVYYTRTGSLIEKYAREAKKHNMSYGMYKAALKNGWIQEVSCDD